MRPHFANHVIPAGSMSPPRIAGARLRETQRARRSGDRGVKQSAPEMAFVRELEDIAALFGKAGDSGPDFRQRGGRAWAKLVMNCAYNAISALVPVNYGRLLATPMRAQSCATSSRKSKRSRDAKAHLIPGDNLSNRRTGWPTPCPRPPRRRRRILHAAGAPRSITSTAIWRGGRALWAFQPVNRTLHALVKLLETSADLAARLANNSRFTNTALHAPQPRRVLFGWNRFTGPLSL